MDSRDPSNTTTTTSCMTTTIASSPPLPPQPIQSSTHNHNHNLNPRKSKAVNFDLPSSKRSRRSSSRASDNISNVITGKLCVSSVFSAFDRLITSFPVHCNDLSWLDLTFWSWFHSFIHFRSHHILYIYQSIEIAITVLNSFCPKFIWIRFQLDESINQSTNKWLTDLWNYISNVIYFHTFSHPNVHLLQRPPRRNLRRLLQIRPQPHSDTRRGDCHGCRHCPLQAFAATHPQKATYIPEAPEGAHKSATETEAEETRRRWDDDDAWY